MIWDTGAKWGGRMYDRTGYDYGNVFYVQRHVSLPCSRPVGPARKTIDSPFLAPIEQNNPLMTLISNSYAILNTTKIFPQNNSHCWLCLSSAPPFYEAIASDQSFNNSTNDINCRWSNSSITVTAIIGQGCCLGVIPANYSRYCLNITNRHKCQIYLSKERSGKNVNTPGFNYVYTTNSKADLTDRLKGQFFIPAKSSVWACSTGVTACVNGDVLIAQKSFCIQVHLLPKIDVYADDDFTSIMEPQQYHLRAKREIVTALTLSVLLGLGVAGAATGVAGLVVSDQQIRQLSANIDEDLKRIETSIVALQNSLTSLSEVVLQNRRGLDLLFLKQGGLCVALKEECCFYADSSGVVLDSMKELNKRLKEREQERISQQYWYQGMFALSPWMTTLMSAIAGPLIILLLICMVGPCIFDRVLRFLKSRLGSLDEKVEQVHTQINALLDPEKAPLLWFSDPEDDTTNEFCTQPKDATAFLTHLRSEDPDSLEQVGP